MEREVVKIDEILCNGCGLCVPGCHEGALQIIDGKARLISELMCYRHDHDSSLLRRTAANCETSCFGCATRGAG